MSNLRPGSVSSASEPSRITTPESIPHLPATGGISDGAAAELEAVTARFGIGVADLASYVDPSERLTGFGNGGSESLVLFLERPGLDRVVRKVCSQAFCTAEWDSSGTGVMSPPATKAGLQVDYLQGLPEAVRPYFPEVRDVRKTTATVQRGGNRATARELIYDLSVIDGVEISSYVAEHQPTPGVVARLHHEVLRCLADRVHPYRHSENGGGTIGPSYLDKIARRLEMCERTAPDIFTPLVNSDSVVINGQRHSNIRELLAFFSRPEVSEQLEPKYHGLVMGDSNTENVMITKPEALQAAADTGELDFTYDDLGITFLDPRAIGYESEGAGTRDDRMYDNKPIHNTLGHYDIIHGEHFSLDLSFEDGTPQINLEALRGNPYEASYRGMERYFGYIMDGWDVTGEEFQQDDPNWLTRFTFMMGTHFAAMPPFHFRKTPDGEIPGEPQIQKRAIALYAQGIKWLNMARDMVTGKRRELYGISVPQAGTSGQPDITISRTGDSYARI